MVNYLFWCCVYIHISNEIKLYKTVWLIPKVLVHHENGAMKKKEEEEATYWWTSQQILSQGHRLYNLCPRDTEDVDENSVTW